MSSIVQVPIVGRFLYRDDPPAPAAGARISFLARSTAVVDGSDVTLPKKLICTLNANGEVPGGFCLPTVGDGVYYTVVEHFAGGRDTFNIKVLPTDTAIDLAVVAPAEPQDVLIPRQPALTWKHENTALAAAGAVTSINVTGPGVEASIVGTSLVLAFTGGGGGGGGLSNDPAQPLGAAAAGTSAWAARADHVHPLPAAPTAADIGLGNVDNTADANKPVSDAQASAIAAAAAAAQAAAIAASEPAGAASAAVSAHTAAADAHAMSGVTGLSAALAARAPTVHTHDVTDVTGLSATLAALAPLASPALTGTPTAPTPTGGDSSTRLATTAFVASALSGTLPASAVGAANGVAGLDAGGKLNAGTLPDLAITQTFVRATQAEMLALTCQQGDVCVRTDQSKSYILVSGSPSTLGNWQELLTPTGMGGTVTSVDLASTTGLTASGGPVTASGSLQYTLSANLQGWHAIAPSSKADATHSHTASAISDSTATGRSLLTATDAAAARAAIGAGTSSFDGTYSALTGKPTLGTAAATAATDYATAAQGAKADTAYGWGNHAAAGYVGTSDSRLADAREWTASTVSQAAAEAGTSTTRYAWTPQRVKQAIVALGGATSPAVSTRLFDDFLTGYATTTATNMATVFPASRSVVACLSATTGASVTQTVEAGAPGLLTLSTGTASNGYARLCSTNGAVVKLGGGEVRFKQRFKIPTLPDVTDDFFVQVGLFNTFVGAADIVRVFCQASGAYGQWQVAAAVGGVGSPAISTPITPVAGTYTTIEGVINAAGTECKIYIDGTLVATMTDPLPTAALAHMTLLIKLAGTTARTLVVDYHELVMTQVR